MENTKIDDWRQEIIIVIIVLIMALILVTISIIDVSTGSIQIEQVACYDSHGNLIQGLSCSREVFCGDITRWIGYCK